MFRVQGAFPFSSGLCFVLRVRSHSVAVVFRVEGAFPFSSGLCFVFRVCSRSVAGCVSCSGCECRD